jgi:hypothetical protein
MKLELLSAQILAGESDEVIGKLLVGTWIAFQAELHGIDDPVHPPPEFSEQVVRLSQAMDTDDVDNIPLTKALILGCSGHWARAGKLIRQITKGGAQQIQTLRLAEAGSKLKIRNRRASARGAQSRSSDAREDRQRWREVGEPLRAKHPTWSNTRLAIEIGNHPSVKAKAHTIRKALPNLDLSRRSKKTDQ